MSSLLVPSSERTGRVSDMKLKLDNYNSQNFNEIMPSIYARFMEQEAKQWRQIYKALQLLEYLVKNGSERVVDDARSHIATIKMLGNFYYIDEKGKYQGINGMSQYSQTWHSLFND